CFFFSSRRRHTRSKRDWSSDVCSSDLGVHAVDEGAAGGVKSAGGGRDGQFSHCVQLQRCRGLESVGDLIASVARRRAGNPTRAEIGRASCRERGEGWEIRGAVEKNESG